MPQLIKGQSFADGDLVTGLTLNNIIDLATLSQTAITSQTAVTTFDIQSSDYFLIYDSSASALRKASVDDILRSGQTVKFSAISGIAGYDLAVAIASGQSFVINGNTSIPANLTVTGLVQGATGKFTTELTIPAGTTATRPASPVAGSFRYNTTIAFIEIYNGTAWIPLTTEVPKIYVKSGTAFGATGAGVENIVYQSPVLTVPSDETWTYQFWVQTTSGEVSGNTRPNYAVVSLKAYNNATLLTTLNGSTSPYGGHTATFTSSKSFTSADTSAKLILKTLNTWVLSEEPKYLVTLTKVKTASLSDNASCI